MIAQFVERFEARKDQLVAAFSNAHPNDYEDLVKTVVEMLSDAKERYPSLGDEEMDPNRITSISDGDYQGTLLFVIGAFGYQPSKYWYVKVGYGSCSGCDTIENIRSKHNFGDTSEPPTSEQVKDYMILALHIVQGLKEME